MAPLPEILEAIEKADILVLGPGSLFTSVLPNLLVPDIAKALKESGKPIIYVANLMTQPGETEGLSFEDHVIWIRNLLHKWPDYVFANNGFIPEGHHRKVPSGWSGSPYGKLRILKLYL